MKETRINYKLLQKMIFIYNALKSGWNIRAKNDKFIFTRKHHNNKEYFQSDYLKKFIENNI
tara:strand:- start:47 stop:229 length:183 start_codon:yes stop_codon:yes gene_type:complete